MAPIRRGKCFLFTDAELKNVVGVNRGDNYVEVTCGCTNARLGDTVGKLRIYANGDLFINCDCTPGCIKDKLTPSEFEKHSERDLPRRWKQNVWVMVQKKKGQKKVPLLRTPLLKYYNKVQSRSNQSFHRDEFVQCTVCQKERRFILRTEQQCRAYHDAAQQLNWKCSDSQLEKLTCDEDEERPCRKSLRGCPRRAKCRGCTSCVCFGCLMCRYSDCGCKLCVDFIGNADL